MTRALLARVVAAAALAAAATCVLGPAAAPASAASCSTASGVSVVVDPGALGGALTTVCDTGSGQVAATRYADIGVSLSYVQRQPGFVCRVNEVPATDPCVNTPPTNAYWALWWTDGESGSWTYASIGVTGLQVPEGGAVALAWQSDAARRTPGIAAPVFAPSPTPTPTKPTKTPTRPPTTKPTPTKQPTRTPTSTGTATTAPTPTTASPSTTDPSASATTEPPSESPSESPSSSGTDSPTASATEEPSEAATSESLPPGAVSDDSASRTEPGSNRVPTWLTLTILASLIVAIGMSTYAARRRVRH